MFTLKIFFLGLIAFVPTPGPEGDELTVLLVDGRQGYTTSDGTEIGPHHAFLMARSGGCQGDCDRGDEATAQFFFSKFGSGASERLSDALAAGAVWRLSEAEISLHPPREPVTPQLTRASTRGTAAAASGLPSDPLEATDFHWIANLTAIEPRAGGIDADHLAPRPLKGWLVARLRLRNGRVAAYRLAGVENQVVPIGFRPLLGGPESNYSQALADSVVAEIQVDSASVEIVEEGFGGGNRRWMRLTPNSAGMVEVALLNMPPVHNGHVHSAPPGAVPLAGLPDPGKHFELFYELAQHPMPKISRAVPHADTRVGVLWSKLYRSQGDSALLAALGLDDPRTVLERTLCPVVYVPPPGG